MQKATEVLGCTELRITRTEYREARILVETQIGVMRQMLETLEVVCRDRTPPTAPENANQFAKQQ